jgi:single-stranded-DNA-specific exonuclease
LRDNTFYYDSEISSHSLKEEFYENLKKLEPYGTGNTLPTFLIKDLKILKSKILNNSHISMILKSKTGFSIKSISFNTINAKMADYLIGYKKNINVIGQISENIWNNKKNLQLTIRDIIL